MKFESELVKNKIVNNVRSSLSKGFPSFPEDQIIKAVDLFIKAIISKIEIKSLTGLPKILLPSLQSIFIENIGNINSLRDIATGLESYLRKISIYTGKINEKELSEIKLMALLKKLELNTELNNQAGNGYPFFSESHKHEFVGKKEYLEEIFNSYYIRNEIHNAANLNEAEIFNYLKDVLVVAIYTTLKYSDVISNLPEMQYNSEYFEKELEIDENKMLYDFISYGNTTTELKDQIIDAFVLHHLIITNQISIADLTTICSEYFQIDFENKFIERKVLNLIMLEKLEYVDILKTSIKLSNDEKDRLETVKESYDENKNLFLMYYQEILEKYGSIPLSV